MLREWRCSWSNADRLCSNYIWAINNFIPYWGVTYIRSLTLSVCSATFCQCCYISQQCQFMSVPRHMSMECIADMCRNEHSKMVIWLATLAYCFSYLSVTAGVVAGFSIMLSQMTVLGSCHSTKLPRHNPPFPNRLLHLSAQQVHNVNLSHRYAYEMGLQYVWYRYHTTHEPVYCAVICRSHLQWCGVGLLSISNLLYSI